MDIRDFAAYFNGSIVYVIQGNNLVRKSTNNGSTWMTLTMHPDLVNPPKCIAVAPDNHDIIAVTDSNANGQAVFASADGGTKWTRLGAPEPDPAAVITDIAITPEVDAKPPLGGREVFVTLADKGGGNVTLGNVKRFKGKSWADTGKVGGKRDYMAVQVSPGYADDRCICVVGATVEKGVDYQIINVVNNSVLQTVTFVPQGSTHDFRLPALPNNILCADIALPFDFNAASALSRRAFVSLATNPEKTTDGVYRIVDTLAGKIFPSRHGCGVRGVALNPALLVLGEYGTNRVRRTANPFAAAVTWTLANRNPVAERVIVRWSNSNCYAGTSGTGSGLFRSNNNADNFQ